MRPAPTHWRRPTPRWSRGTSTPARDWSSPCNERPAPVGAAYDELDSPDLRQDLVLILAGNGAVVALRGFGVAAANDMGKRWVRANATRETMKQVNKVVSRKILTKAGRSR